MEIHGSSAPHLPPPPPSLMGKFLCSLHPPPTTLEWPATFFGLSPPSVHTASSDFTPSFKPTWSGLLSPLCEWGHDTHLSSLPQQIFTEYLLEARPHVRGGTPARRGGEEENVFMPGWNSLVRMCLQAEEVENPIPSHTV